MADGFGVVGLGTGSLNRNEGADPELSAGRNLHPERARGISISTELRSLKATSDGKSKDLPRVPGAASAVMGGKPSLDSPITP